MSVGAGKPKSAIRKWGAVGNRTKFVPIYGGPNPNDRHARITERMEASPAYRALSGNDKSLLTVLMLIHNGRNNGQIALSVREAAERINTSEKTALKCFSSLQEHGFISAVKKGSFSVKQRHATTWRITEYGTAADWKPTKEYMSWRPETDQKREPEKIKTRRKKLPPTEVKSSPVNDPSEVKSTPDGCKNYTQKRSTEASDGGKNYNTYNTTIPPTEKSTAAEKQSPSTEQVEQSGVAEQPIQRASDSNPRRSGVEGNKKQQPSIDAKGPAPLWKKFKAWLKGRPLGTLKDVAAKLLYSEVQMQRYLIGELNMPPGKAAKLRELMDSYPEKPLEPEPTTKRKKAAKPKRSAKAKAKKSNVSPAKHTETAELPLLAAIEAAPPKEEPAPEPEPIPDEPKEQHTAEVIPMPKLSRTG